jgi:hypothetical protein
VKKIAQIEAPQNRFWLLFNSIAKDVHYNRRKTCKIKLLKANKMFISQKTVF